MHTGRVTWCLHASQVTTTTKLQNTCNSGCPLLHLNQRRLTASPRNLTRCNAPVGQASSSGSYSHLWNLLVPVSDRLQAKSSGHAPDLSWYHRPLKSLWCFCSKETHNSERLIVQMCQDRGGASPPWRFFILNYACFFVGLAEVNLPGWGPAWRRRTVCLIVISEALVCFAQLSCALQRVSSQRWP